MLDLLHFYNPWWVDGAVPTELAPPYVRPLIEKFSDYSELKRVFVLKGPRRTGKSTLLYQWIREKLSEGLDPSTCGRDQGRSAGPGGRAHFRQPGYQKGAMPRGWQRSCLAQQGTPLVGTRLSFPRPHPMSVGQPRLQAPVPRRRRRWLHRRGPRTLVQRCDPAPQTLASAAEANPSHQDG